MTTPDDRAKLTKAQLTAPKIIWLELGDDREVCEVGFGELSDVTWSEDSATIYGVEYIRADLAADLPDEVRAAIEVTAYANGYRDGQAFAAALIRPDSAYPLPDDLYAGSKDWAASNYAGRVEWLHVMYESAKGTIAMLEARPDSAAPAGVEVDVVTAAIHQSCKALIRRYTEDNAGFIRMARDAAIDAVLALAAPKAPAAAQEPMWFDPHETARRRALQPPSAPKAEEVSPPAKCLICGSETEHYECKPKADERGSVETITSEFWQKVGDTVEQSLAHYRCSTIGDASDEGASGFPLTDVFCQCDGTSMETARHEMELLCDHILIDLHESAATEPGLPALTDAMRDVLRNEHDVYQSEDALYDALCLAARASAGRADK